MSNERECGEFIRKIVGKTNFSTYLCKVKIVNGATCDVVRAIDDMEIKDVRINSTITENEGLVIAPKVNSYVLITDIDGDKWFVSQYSQIDSITLDVDNKIVINGGNNDGIIKINELTQKLNDLVNAFNNHIHTTTATVGAALVAGEISAPTPQAQNFNKTYYENDKILH